MSSESYLTSSRDPSPRLGENNTFLSPLSRVVPQVPLLEWNPSVPGQISVFNTVDRIHTTPRRGIHGPSESSLRKQLASGSSGLVDRKHFEAELNAIWVIGKLEPAYP